MALLSVIRRWALRDQLSIREIARRTGLSRNTIRKYLRLGTVQPEFKVPDRPSKLDPYAEKLAAWLKTDAGKSRKQRRTSSSSTPTSSPSATRAPTTGSRPLRGSGGRIGSATSRAPDVGFSCRSSSSPAKPSSSTGARTGRRSRERARSFRSPTSSCRTAGRSCSGPTCFRPTRCCSTPTGTHSGSSTACRGEDLRQ